MSNTVVRSQGPEYTTTSSSLSPSSTTSSPPASSSSMHHSPLQDLRHMTSNHDLLTPTKESTQRRPTKLATGASSSTPPKLGNRNQTSIPSSPSSVHSSSSAIFERDIEPLPSSLFSTADTTLSPNHYHNHNHHNSQSLVLESAVPAVLSSAAAALAEDGNKETSMNISVISPASPTPHVGTSSNAPSRSMSIPVSTANSTFGGSVMGSRSPSPTRRSFSVQMSPESASPSQRPVMIERTSTGPLPPGAFPSGGGAKSLSPTTSGSPSPTSLSPIANTISLPSMVSDPHSLPALTHQQQQHQHQQQQQQSLNHSKRLSFISYTDLLTSTPLSSVPLSSLVQPQSSEPPPHIPAVLGPPAGSNASMKEPESMGEEGGEWVGGEWEREGFGRGLEARLEEVLNEGKAPSLQMTAS